jgi:hypothetical protein
MLFRFHDGKRLRRADPLAIAIALHSHPTYLPRHLKDAVDGDKDALQIVAQAATDVFQVQPLQTGGLTLQERFELMLGFDLYIRKLKKNTVVSATSPSSTASTSEDSSKPTTNATSPSF